MLFSILQGLGREPHDGLQLSAPRPGHGRRGLITALLLAFLAISACEEIGGWGSGGHETAGVDAIADQADPFPGFVGAFGLTYYYMVYETSFTLDAQGQDLPDLPMTELRDMSCASLAQVATSFADAICVEGSGMIRDGRIVNLALDCACGHPCPNGRRVCFQMLDAEAFPYGMGAEGNALEPLRSLATDSSILTHGTVVYLPDWDGQVIPDVDGLGAFIHDGCFRADDIGHGVDGYHLDIFAGSPGMWQALEWYLPTSTILRAYDDPERCAALRDAQAP